MEKQQLADALSREFITLRAQCKLQSGNFSSENVIGRQELITEKTAALTAYFAHAPYSSAKAAAADLDMSREEIIFGYKLIQRTSAAADTIRLSVNGDYLNIVRHYFSGRTYVVVFFTGLACPGRCSFCPNVTILPDGRRHLSIYGSRQINSMSPVNIESVFRDIDKITRQNTSILVKISGGLEPLTDPDTMAVILNQADTMGIHVKLFTNGILLNTPRLRRLALKAGDVRVSLSMVDEEAYGEMMFGNDTTRRRQYGLPVVLENLRCLVKERDRLGISTRIGINTVVLEENHRELERFVYMAKDLGLDYIDFKPNYFSTYTAQTLKAISDQRDSVKAQSGKGIDIYFADSLSGDNMFWHHRDGECEPHKQSMFKMFITPSGDCSPVHHGAFPRGRAASDTGVAPYSIGRICEKASLLDLISNMPRLPGLRYEKLNPFEHMLALEIKREEQDRAWGIPDSCNPYHFSKGDILPRQILENPLLY
ncbi:radical SAM protein [uncultured Desulfobacter sp.]|uniref:radical SAM protein n=1 Tax=uncultured Desulfobacter sp. TaxID=240139 RepID=UPI0029F49EA8|nr:radical SAM protein [uncultured Desulfobacter sp.]